MQVFQLVSEAQRETCIDLFIQEPFDFETEYRASLRCELFPGSFVPVVNFDTLIAMKRKAGRPKDLENIRNLELGGGSADPAN